MCYYRLMDSVVSKLGLLFKTAISRMLPMSEPVAAR